MTNNLRDVSLIIFVRNEGEGQTLSRLAFTDTGSTSLQPEALTWLRIMFADSHCISMNN